MILAHKKQTSAKSTENLCNDVVWHLLPRKARPDCKAQSHSRVEVTTGGGSAYYNSECDADGIGPSDLEQRAKSRLNVIDEE